MIVHVPTWYQTTEVQDTSGWTPHSVAAAQCSSPQHSHNLYHPLLSLNHRRSLDADTASRSMTYCRSTTTSRPIGHPSPSPVAGPGLNGTGYHSRVASSLWLYAGGFLSRLHRCRLVIHDTTVDSIPFDSNTSVSLIKPLLGRISPLPGRLYDVLSVPLVIKVCDR